MKILIADNETLAVESLLNTLRSVDESAVIKAVYDSAGALKTAACFLPDVAFLDIEMPGMNGIALARAIKEQVNPRINIIFTTGYSEYIEEAFIRLRASGYLMKPITGDMVRHELDNLRYPVELGGDKRVRIRAFGAFEIFIDEKPVIFHYSKTKELCAYLIDREGMCSVAELLENLWEDGDKILDHRSYLQNMISDLTKTFNEQGLKDVIIKKYGSIGIDATKLDCDYYAYKSSLPAAINAFRGEYMTQYSWAERTLGGLVFEKK